MDLSTFFTGSASGIGASAVLVVLYKLWKYLINKRFHSKCNDNTLDVELQVENITPKAEKHGTPHRTDTVRNETKGQTPNEVAIQVPA